MDTDSGRPGGLSSDDGAASVSTLRASIPDAVRLAPTLSSDLAGELLRELSFRYEYGAYSCFDMRDGFLEIPPSRETIPLDVRTALLGSEANEPFTISGISHHHHREANLDVYWHWDGDGTLVFVGPGLFIYNTDCKKSYGWERRRSGDWIEGYWHSDSDGSGEAVETIGSTEGDSAGPQDIAHD